MPAMPEEVIGDCDTDPAAIIWDFVVAAIEKRDLSPEVRKAHAYLVDLFGADKVPALG